MRFDRAQAVVDAERVDWRVAAIADTEQIEGRDPRHMMDTPDQLDWLRISRGP